MEKHLSGRVVLVPNLGWIGTCGRELVKEFASGIEASKALECWPLGSLGKDTARCSSVLFRQHDGEHPHGDGRVSLAG